MASIQDPIFPDISTKRREQAQEDFGRHLVEQRNRMAARVRKWIESDAKFPIPLYDRLIDRIRELDSKTREDVASIALLMADEILWAALTVFGTGEDTRMDGKVVNYTVVAQVRRPGTEDILEQVDIDRGEPVIVLSKEYKRWLSRHAPTEL